MTEVTIDPALFRRVLGSYPTGVCVIAAIDADGAPVGMIVGTFTSVSLDPPLVGFLVDRGSRRWPRIAAAGHFRVSVLGSDQREICRQLVGGGPHAFADVAFSLSERGLPMVTGALASIECAIAAVNDAGDHHFVLGRVLALDLARHGDPMLFYRGRYGGFSEMT